jgi:hypothetical protein
MSAANIENIGKMAVKQLRVSKLSRGFSFMITSKELSDGEAYLEHPDGKMDLVTAKKDAVEFTVIRNLTAQEANTVRENLHLNA